MKKLNIVFSFVLLSFCLLINVSTAEIVADVKYSSATTSGNTTTAELFGYTGLDIHKLMYRYIKNSESYADDFNTLISSASANGYNYFIFNSESITSKYYAFLPKDMDVAFYQYSSSGDRFNLAIESSSELPVYFGIFNISNSVPSSNGLKQYPLSNLEYGVYIDINYYIKKISLTPFETNTNVKLLNTSLIWDGTTYLYQAPSIEEPETPIMPTNSEIASVVQSFYDSDLYKNNTNFKDFMVVYSFVTGYYSIIGTDNHLLQEIYYDGAKPSNDDFTYPETWWRFYNYLGNLQNLFYGSNYWLYSTLKVDDVLSPIKYDGVGKLNNLFNLKFTNQSVIVYSSYEYEVYEYWPPESDYEIETGTNKKEVTTIPGDQYTYDETLDPTDSEYSPIQNYIPVNPNQTILGDVDFDEINKTFEENKDILNIEGASWLFTANNKLVSYFIGFLSLLIVFLIISRILGG